MRAQGYEASESSGMYRFLESEVHLTLWETEAWWGEEGSFLKVRAAVRAIARPVDLRSKAMFSVLLG